MAPPVKRKNVFSAVPALGNVGLGVDVGALVEDGAVVGGIDVGVLVGQGVAPSAQVGPNVGCWALTLICGVLYFTTNVKKSI